MKAPTRVLPVFVVALASLAGCVLAPPVYWAKSIQGRVVDAETNAPIEGAVVIADWKLYSGGYGHGDRRNSLLIEQTLTDTDGKFRFDKWGPKTRPAWEVLDKAPIIVVLKAGYDYQNLWNDEASNSILRSSYWDGKTVSLRRSVRKPVERMANWNLLLFISPQPQLMLMEILKEENTYEGSRAESRIFFQHIRELLDRERRK